MLDGNLRFLPPLRPSIEEQRKLLQIGGCTKETIAAAAAYTKDLRHLNWPNIAALAVWVVSVGLLFAHAVRSRRAVGRTAVGAKTAAEV